MDSETTFRIVFLMSAIAMVAIRSYYQSKVLSDRRPSAVVGKGWRLIPGAVSAVTTLVFGLAYIFLPAAFPWSYAQFPDGLRWVGAFTLLGGLLLLAAAHRHLAASFHSLVVRKSGQVLVASGPYRSIRHPIYTAYFLNYLGGGLLASSLVLTFIPALFFSLLVALRIREEEAAMLDQFGSSYQDYMAGTGRFVPLLRSSTRPGRK